LKKPLALEKAWSGRNNTAAEEDRTKARAGICSDAEGENQRQPQKPDPDEQHTERQNRFTRIWEAKRKPSSTNKMQK
jgi:hypothetical protein